MFTFQSIFLLLFKIFSLQNTQFIYIKLHLTSVHLIVNNETLANNCEADGDSSSDGVSPHNSFSVNTRKHFITILRGLFISLLRLSERIGATVRTRTKQRGSGNIESSQN